MSFLKKLHDIFDTFLFEFVTKFTNQFILISIIGLISTWLIFKYSRDNSLKEHAFRLSLLCFCFATGFLWLTLFFSSVEIVAENPLKEPVGKGGFPLTCFYYPIHPMGSGFPPAEQWAKFFLNYLFYFLISLTAIINYRKNIADSLRQPKGFKRIVFSAFFLLNFIGLVYVFFKFE